jgi:hypothetical protein
LKYRHGRPEKRAIGDYLRTLRGSGKAFIFTGGASVLSEPTKDEWSDNSFAETVQTDPAELYQAA